MTDSTVAAAFRVEWRDVLTVLALVTASHCLYGLLGVRFDASPFPGYMQFIDIELLRHRLLESLWYYHAQPPLLNLFAGVGVKLLPTHAGLFFALCFQLLGAVIDHDPICACPGTGSSERNLRRTMRTRSVTAVAASTMNSGSMRKR